MRESGRGQHRRALFPVHGRGFSPATRPSEQKDKQPDMTLKHSASAPTTAASALEATPGSASAPRARTVRRALLGMAAALMVAGSLAVAAPAGAADCPSGEFCAWEHADYGGQRANWSGDDSWWESYIADEDSAWANHGISGPGIKDHVKVYSRSGQGGDMTICLTPGQEVASNGAANDKGDSHTWAMRC